MIPAPIEQVLTLLQDDQLLLDGGLGLSVREEPQSGTLGSMRAGALTAVTKSAVVASASSVSRDNVAIANAPPIGFLLGKNQSSRQHPSIFMGQLAVSFREGIYILPKLDKADSCLLNHPSNCYEKKPMPNPCTGPPNPPRTSVSVKKPFNKVISSASPSTL